MLNGMALVTFSLNKIARNLFHSSVVDGIKDVAQNTTTRKVRLCMRESTNN